MDLPDDDLERTDDLAPCPFCGAGEHRITVSRLNNAPRMDGKLSAIISVTIRHWCRADGLRRRMIVEVVGRDREDAVAQWTARPPQ